MSEAIAVIGSVNMDIGGYSDRPLTAGDSNPGRVRMSLGGVRDEAISPATWLSLGRRCAF